VIFVQFYPLLFNSEITKLSKKNTTKGKNEESGRTNGTTSKCRSLNSFDVHQMLKFKIKDI
jgi:hypothetical protein